MLTTVSRWIRDNPLTAAVLLVVLPAAGAVAIAEQGNDAELKRVLYAGAGTLVFGGLLGGLLKIVLDGVAASRQKREDDATFVRNVLNDLKAVYDRVGRGRVLIPAHQSVKTYGEEMRDLIQSRVQLKNVMRALEGRVEGVRADTQTAVYGAVEKMEKYLAKLTNEFRDRYKPLSDRQRRYEAQFDALLKQAGEAGLKETPAFTKEVWEELLKLPELKDFIGEESGSTYKTEFIDQLDNASEILRDELAHLLGRPSPRAGSNDRGT